MLRSQETSQSIGNFERESKYYIENEIDRTMGKLKFNGDPTIIKASDGDNADEISNFKRLTKLDNN